MNSRFRVTQALAGYSLQYWSPRRSLQNFCASCGEYFGMLPCNDHFLHGRPGSWVFLDGRLGQDQNCLLNFVILKCSQHLIDPSSAVCSYDTARQSP